MPTRPMTDKQVKEAYALVKKHKTIAAAARAAGISKSTLQSRIKLFHTRYPDAEVAHPGPGTPYRPAVKPWQDVEVKNGHVIVFSDAHFWPGVVSAANMALVELIKQLKPVGVIGNGDLFDGASISRHDPLGWEERPSVGEELEALTERMDEITAASRGAWRMRTQGNHDARFDRYLAVHASSMRDVNGVQLSDYLPKWPVSWAIRINKEVVVKHRKAGGLHAAYNNTLRNGTSMVTGHLHRLCITPWDDARGRRWGVDCGTLADADGAHVEYTESSSPHGASGFAVLTFRNGVLMPPELCEVVNGVACFRGQPVITPPKGRERSIRKR